MFPTVTYESRVSHFDPQSQHRDFHGFFALFWIGLSIMVLTTALRNLKDTGTVFRSNIFSLFAQGTLELGFTDLAMALSTGVVVPLQQRFAKGGETGWSWANGGWAFQHTLQAVWLGIWVYWPFMRNWGW